MSIASIDAYNKYTMSRYVLTHIIKNTWSIGPEFQDCLSMYRLMVVPKDKFLKFFKFGQYTHPETRIPFDVVFHKTSRGKLLADDGIQEVMLSYRVAQPEFDIAPTVLVKPYYPLA